MPHRRDMAETMMIDFHPDMGGQSSLETTRPAGRRIVVRRTGQSTPRVAASKASRSPATTLSDELVAFFEGIYDAALLTDMAGNIVDANVRAVQFFGYTRNHFKRSAIGEIVAGIGGEILATINTNLRNNQFTLLQTDCRRMDGSGFPAEISTSVIPFCNKQFLCFFVRDVSVRRAAEEALKKAHDDLARQVEERTRYNQELQQEISERKRIESELTAAIAQLQKHDEAKSEFISNVSHEFRTPLTSIKYVTDNMLRGISGEMSHKARDYLSMILADCDRLARAVEDILDLSRIDADALSMNWVRAPIGRLVQRTVDSLRVQAEKEGLTVSCRISEEVMFATCDVQKFERVILNIVKNAIKFTPAGGHVDIHVHNAIAPIDATRITVCDNGSGIPPQHIERVTERYYRVGEYVSGTGLGLAICKEIIAFHNGELELISPVPATLNGTQVTVMLPRVSPPQIVLLCGSESIGKMLSEELREQGYILRTDVPVTEMINTLTISQKPLMIALDWTVPGMDAAIALAQLQESPVYKVLPLLVLIGATRDPARDEILQGLGVPVLQAPWSPGDLLNMLEGMIPDCPNGEA